MSRSTPATPARARGQSMVEVAVTAAVLIPLFLLVPVLGKYIHTRQTVQQAARAAAWEATVSPGHALPDVGATRERLLDRHFGGGRDAIATAARGGAADAAVGNVMFNTWTGQPLVRRGDVSLRPYTDESAPGAVGDAAAVLAAIPLGWNTPNRRGLVTADLAVATRNLGDRDGNAIRGTAPFDAIDLEFTARQTLLADPWNASGPRDGARSVTHQVTPLAPTVALTSCETQPELIDGVSLPNLCPLSEMQEYLQDFVDLPMVDLSILEIPLRLDLDHMEPDVVPYDKLQAEP